MLVVVYSGTAQALSVHPLRADSSYSPSEFRDYTNHHKTPCEDGSFDCLANHLMYLQCGAILIEKMARNEGEFPQWYVYSMHSGPKAKFSIAGYYLLYWLDPSLPASWRSGEQFDPFAKIASNFNFDVVIHDEHLASRGNQHLADLIQQTLDWMDTQDWIITDACQLQEYWKELGATSFSPPQNSVSRDDCVICL